MALVRTAIVTGGASGIGLAIVRRLLADGVSVAIGARDLASPARQAVLEGLRQAAPRVPLHAAELDLLDPQGPDRFTDWAMAQLGRVDILVNAAGITAEQPVSGHDDALWQRIIDTNLTGAFRMIRAVLPSMMAAGWGRIVNIGSTAATAGWRDNPAYCASKAGLLGLTRCVAQEAAAQGVTCNMASPAWVETPLMRDDVAQIVARQGSGRSVEEEMARIAASNPQGRILQPEEVAALTAFLCGEAAGGITGEDFRITGGASW